MESTPVISQSFGVTADRPVHFLVQSTVDPLQYDGPNVIEGLSGSPKKISSVYVYDKRGTELFELQCGTPEYYLRRVETRLLNSHAGDIVRQCESPAIVELGAGTAEKTRILLAEYARRGLHCDYFPIDVDLETLAECARGLASAFPLLSVQCLGTTYERGLRTIPQHASPKLFLFLGSSLGNMEWRQIDVLLSQLFESGANGDHLLIGADLDKDPVIIDRAYNDSAGYGPRSTLNVLDHLNHRYDGNFIVGNFRYRSRYDSRTKRNEVRIESLVHQTVTLASLTYTVSFDPHEAIDAEVMLKFDPDELAAVLERAGFTMVRRWIDPVYRYGLFLLRHK
jgi:L-histidine N-alpha-methyltransferase